MKREACMLGVGLCLLGACAEGAGDGDTAIGGPDTVSASATTGAGGTGGAGATTGGGAAGAAGGNPPTAATPRQGEVIFVEIFPDPATLSDFDAEWFELKNVTAEPLSLDACRLKDRDPNGDDLSLAGLGIVIEPGAIALFAKKDDPSLNGGLSNVVYAFGTGFSLGNGGDEVRLECDDIRIDEVAYTSSWPYGNGTAMQLQPTLETATDNDLPESWCSAAAFYVAGERGTPSFDNQCN